MTDPVAALQREADLIDACKRAGGAMFLAPSSHLGKIFAAATAAALRARAPGVRIVAVDDLLEAQATPVDGFDAVLPSAALHRDPHLAGFPAINCGYTIPTWLHFARLVQQIGGHHVDLPELMYALDVTLIYETGRTTRTQTLAHTARFHAVRARLADDLSVRTLDAVLQMALNGDRSPLLDVLCPGEQEYFSMFLGNPHPIQIGADEHYVDIGAYDGDTVRKFRVAARDRYAAIHAFEPDAVNFAALQQGLREDGGRTTLYNAAVADIAGTMAFDAQGTMGSRLDGSGTARVDCLRLDDVVERATLLKMDVEGAEPTVLRGATELIRRCRPRMAITCYHHALDLLDIVAELDRILPNARLRLRKYSLYFYDTVLYVE